MKSVRPVKEQQGCDYPTAQEAGITRRGLLRVVLAGGAAAAGSVILGGEGAARRLRGVKPRPRYHVAITLTPPIRLGRCKSEIVQILAHTYSYQVKRFLENPKALPGIRAVIRKALRSYKCADLNKPIKRSVMQTAVSSALNVHYKKKSGNTWGTVSWVTLKTSPP